jgi:hypothetical protein
MYQRISLGTIKWRDVCEGFTAYSILNNVYPVMRATGTVCINYIVPQEVFLFHFYYTNLIHHW